jgi:hypothetical protein
MQDVVALTHTVVERGLHRAQGSTRRLEPELGDWLFGEKSITLYRTSQQTLCAIQRSLECSHVLHAPASTESGVLRALAITPALFVEDLDEAPLLEHIPLTQA